MPSNTPLRFNKNAVIDHFRPTNTFPPTSSFDHNFERIDNPNFEIEPFSLYDEESPGFVDAFRNKMGRLNHAFTDDGTIVDKRGDVVGTKRADVPVERADVPVDGTGEFDKQAFVPGTEERVPLGQRNPDLGANITQAASVAVPAAVAIANFANQDRSGLVPKVDHVNLATPAVESLPEPQIMNRFRKPIGSDLATREAALRFGDVGNEKIRSEFRYKNASFKLQQRLRNVATKNQEETINKRLDNRRNMIKSQLKNAQLERLQSAGNNAVTGVVQNLSSLVNQKTTADAFSRAQIFDSLVRGRNLGTDQIQQLIGATYGKKYQNRYDMTLKQIS
jgi:hypothetical protein